jgi:hypothetical protein
MFSVIDAFAKLYTRSAIRSKNLTNNWQNNYFPDVGFLDQHKKFTDNLKVLASIDVDKSHMIRAMKPDIKPITTVGGQVPAPETESIKEAVENSDLMRAMKPKIIMSVEDKESIDEDVEIEHSIEEFEAEAKETCHPKDLNCGMALPKATEEVVLIVR